MKILIDTHANFYRLSRLPDGVLLVLSDRKAHCETLVGLLADRGVDAAMLHGDLNPAARHRVVKALNGGPVKVLVATGQLIGEGFDCRDLSTLFLATPIKFSGRLLQYLGRVLRPAAPGKDKARVYDYLDPVGVLENAALARQWVYGPQGEIAHAIQKFNNKKGISSAVQAGVAGQGELA